MIVRELVDDLAYIVDIGFRDMHNAPTHYNGCLAFFLEGFIGFVENPSGAFASFPFRYGEIERHIEAIYCAASKMKIIPLFHRLIVNN